MTAKFFRLTDIAREVTLEQLQGLRDKYNVQFVNVLCNIDIPDSPVEPGYDAPIDYALAELYTLLFLPGSPDAIHVSEMILRALPVDLVVRIKEAHEQYVRAINANARRERLESYVLFELRRCLYNDEELPSMEELLVRAEKQLSEDGDAKEPPGAATICVGHPAEDCISAAAAVAAKQ